MRFYIALIILLSLITCINMKDHDNERSKSRLSITSRGIYFQVFLNTTNISAHRTTVPSHAPEICSQPPLTARLRFLFSRRGHQLALFGVATSSSLLGAELIKSCDLRSSLFSREPCPQKGQAKKY
jgi:hypothetical protein